MNKVLVVVGLLCLSACASGERKLSQEEMDQNGLTGRIYDAPFCPVKVINGVPQAVGECERVTCEPGSDGLECTARKSQ
ncbi:MAG: hypothetical protein AB7F86_09180 [Bdellovibrionales bacterium]